MMIIHRNVILSFYFFCWQFQDFFSYACRKNRDKRVGFAPGKAWRQFNSAMAVHLYRMVAV